MESSISLLRLDPSDNVAVACREIGSGEHLKCEDIDLVALQSVPVGFKVALTDIPSGGKLIKHGGIIGSATTKIVLGEIVHLHNLKSDYLQTAIPTDADRTAS